MNSRELKALIAHNGMPWFFENYLAIKAQDSPTDIPFRLNNVQRDIVWPEFQRQLDTDGMVRLYVLKARRMGLSTFVGAYIYTNTIFNRNTISYIIAHKMDAAKTLFAMYEKFYQASPLWLQPKTRRANAREMLFDNPDRAGKPGLGSHIKVMASDDKMQKMSKGGIGRSDNIFHVHGSESAFWGPGAGEIQNALQQSVPRVPGTTIVYESTGAEAGGAFYEGYQRAKRGKGRYRALFIPWFRYDKYRLPLEPGEILDLDYSEDTLLRMGATLEALKWRRRTLVDECNNKIEKFQQEYPSTDDEAFLMSQGRNVFNVGVLRHMREMAEDITPARRYRTDRGVLLESASGPLKVWKEPSAGRQYIVGCDPAEGLQDGCYQAIEVVDCSTLEQAAEWAAMVPTNELARVLCAVGQKYNNAMLAPEFNNHGLAVIQAIHDLGYGNLYRMESFGQVRHNSAPKWGWLTTGVTKPLLESFFDSMVMDGQLLINSPELIMEAEEYVHNPDGTSGGRRTGPPQGKFSDRLMAYMIAIFLSDRRFPRGRQDRRLMDARRPRDMRVGDDPLKIVEENRRRKPVGPHRRIQTSHGAARVLYRGR